MNTFWGNRPGSWLEYLNHPGKSRFTYSKAEDMTGSSIPSLDQYEKAETEEEESDDGTLRGPSDSSSKPSHFMLQQHPRTWTSYIFAACLLLNMTLLCIIMFMLRHHHHTSQAQSTFVSHSEPTGQEFGSCGENGDIAAARAAGCVFDPASLIWTRPECYDQDLVDSFLARTDWSFYTNKTLLPQYEIPYDEWLRGEHPIVFAPRKFHLVHCYYMWEKLHKAYLTGGPMDSEVAQLHHTRHCSKALLNDYLGEDSCAMGARCPTYAGTTWTSCGYYH